ncbi:MAG: DUF4912 domain-containing protein [Pirellulales bacterium]
MHPARNNSVACGSHPSGGQPLTTAASLKECTCKDLAEMAKKEGVSGWHSMRKDQLVTALLKVARKSGPSSKSSSAGVGARSRSATTASRRTSKTVQTRRKATGRRNGAKQEAPAAPRSSAVMRRIKKLQQSRDKEKNLAYRDGRSKQPEPKKDRLIVMVRDPYWLHVHWELQRQSVERAAAALGQHWHAATPIVRLLSVTADGTTNATERVIRDIEIHGGVNNWYIDVDDPPGTYRLEIGYLAESGQFFSMARSNVVTTPKPGSKDAIDENWSDVARNYDRVYAMSGGYDGERTAQELQELFEERLRRPMGSPLVTKYGISPEAILNNKSEFVFDVEAEMIIYGVTNPNARVTLRGEPVELREDGSFTVRMSMPDRRQVIPVVASTADGVEQRTTVIAIERNTKVMETLIREPEDSLSS